MENEPRLPARLEPGPPYARLPGPPARPWYNGGGGGGRGAGSEAEIDWRRWAYVMWRRKWWIVAVTLLGTAPAVIVAQNYDPLYQSKALIWIDQTATQHGAPIDAGNVFSALGLVDLLGSYALLEPVVDELKLYLHAPPEYESFFENLALTDSAEFGSYRLLVRPNATYAILDAEDRALDVGSPGEPLGASLGFRWSSPRELLSPGTEIPFSVARPRNVADHIRYNLEIGLTEDGSFIHLTYRSSSPTKVTLVLNTILDRFQRLASDLKREKLASLVATLEEQKETATARLREAEGALQRFRISTITLPNDRGAYARPDAAMGADPALDSYFTLRVQRDSVRQDREALAQVLREVRETGKLDAMKLESVPSVRVTSSLVAALDELGRKEAEYRSLRYRYTPEHASVKRVADDLAALQRRTIPAIVSQLKDRLAARESELKAQLAGQEAELEQIPPRTIEAERLRREVNLAAEVYNSLQVRYKEAQVAEAATQPNVRIIDRASSAPYPLGTGALATVVVAFTLSLGLGVAGVVLHERFAERRIRYPEQVFRDLQLPILGLVPNLKMLTAGNEDDGAVPSPSVRCAIESFRGLRTRLTRGLGVRYPFVVAITSPAAGEGKSLVAGNLALAFADRNRPTVLIDGDLRRGALHRAFGQTRAPGLAEYLRARGRAAPVFQQTETEGLHLMARGSFSEEAAELLDGEGLARLLAYLKETFQVILIDTPPLAAGVDSVLICGHADAVVAVLRLGRTDLELARAKLAGYAQMLGVPLVGAVLNDVDTDRGPYRYYTDYAYDAYPYEPNEPV